MSYGKQDNHTDRIAASTAQQMGNARRFQQTGRQAPPTWANRYYPTKVGSDTIRLIPGNYAIQRLLENGEVITEQVPWYEATEHYYNARKQGIVCSGGIFRNHKTKKEPCVGCEMYWADWNKRNEVKQSTGQKVTTPNRVSKSDRFIFHVLDMGYWFKGPDFDDRGLPKTDDKGNEYKKWIKYDGSPKHQQLLAMVTEEKDKRWGRLLDWNMGREHFGVLTKYADYTGNNCSSCGGVNSLRVHRWYCRTCHADMFDQQTLMLPEQQLRELVNKPSACLHCRAIGYPAEHLACTNCPNPVRASIFDVELTLMAQEDPTTKALQLCFLNVSAPKPVPDHFRELLEKLPDLAAKYAPTPYADQQTKFQQMGPREQPAPPAPPAPPVGMAAAPNQMPVVQSVPNYAVPYSQTAPVQPHAQAHQQAPMATPPATPPMTSGWGSK